LSADAVNSAEVIELMGLQANETRKRNAAVKAVGSTPENVTPVETTPEAAPKVSE